MQCQSAISQLVFHKPVHSSKLISDTQVSSYDVKPYHNSALNKFMILYCSSPICAAGLSELLLHYSLFCGQTVDPILVTFGKM